LDLLEEQYNTFEDKIVTIGCGDNEKDLEVLKEEVNKRIDVKKVYIARGGACICSHTGPGIFAISCSN
ncbi:MAG: DegV family protein, partial [Peptostreptococcaceae bacterium]|nr:DegV family protein [Peptostreptococcaceae bacterium]